MSKLRYCIFALFSLCAFNLLAQSPEDVEHIIHKIYNLDFENIQKEIAIVQKTDPQMAGYLKIDFLWWQMISRPTIATEESFVQYLDSMKDKKSGIRDDFETLTSLMYQMRYENFKKETFSRYITAYKFHIFVDKLDEKKIGPLSSLEMSIIELTKELDLYMKYKYALDVGFNSKKNTQQYQLCLRNMENMQNKSFPSFKTIKTYLLGKIYFEIENDYVNANEKFGQLSVDFPNNRFFDEISKDCKKHLAINLQ